MSGERLTHAQRAATGATPGDLGRSGELVALEDKSALQAIYDAEREQIADAITHESHVLALLAWAAGVDRIARGKAEAEAWLETLRGYSLQACREAVTEHYRRSTFAVMPANIIRIIDGE